MKIHEINSTYPRPPILDVNFDNFKYQTPDIISNNLINILTSSIDYWKKYIEDNSKFITDEVKVGFVNFIKELQNSLDQVNVVKTSIISKKSFIYTNYDKNGKVNNYNFTFSKVI